MLRTGWRVQKVAWKGEGAGKVMKDLGWGEEGVRQGSCPGRGLLMGVQTWGKGWRLPMSQVPLTVFRSGSHRFLCGPSFLLHLLLGLEASRLLGICGQR